MMDEEILVSSNEWCKYIKWGADDFWDSHGIYIDQVHHLFQFPQFPSSCRQLLSYPLLSTFLMPILFSSLRLLFLPPHFPPFTLLTSAIPPSYHFQYLVSSEFPYGYSKFKYLALVTTATPHIADSTPSCVGKPPFLIFFEVYQASKFRDTPQRLISSLLSSVNHSRRSDLQHTDATIRTSKSKFLRYRTAIYPIRYARFTLLTSSRETRRHSRANVKTLSTFRVVSWTPARLFFHEK
ncbi:hypothetical protein BJX68DRAFT_29517 [Aspergillus pseudodeflectus]|uniref:Uncharacterized protein n=1 Tax=Aspergillus pseudodeflectus TaxID=176178 RepID=A0ABR4KQG8_9EURO